MFPYTEKYTESESDIQNNDLLYKIDQQCQNTFDFLNKLEFSKKSKSSNVYCVFYINSIIHILHFVCKFWIFNFCKLLWYGDFG